MGKEREFCKLIIVSDVTFDREQCFPHFMRKKRKDKLSANLQQFSWSGRAGYNVILLLSWYPIFCQKPVQIYKKNLQNSEYLNNHISRKVKCTSPRIDP